jgi:large subunit ribosomal protein L7e
MVATRTDKKQSDLPLVPESVLKKRHDLDDLARKRAALEEVEAARTGKKHKKKTAVYVVKPETILSQSRSRRNNEIRYKRVNKKGMQKRAVNHKVTAVKEVVNTLSDGNDVDDVQEISYQANSVGAPMVFAVRIRDAVAVPPQVRTALGRLRLKKIHDGVFVKYDDNHRKLLHLVEPFVVYGPPSNAAVKDLIERRGYAKINGERVPLSDNNVIEDVLGEKHNILCIEDLVHELCSAGESFDAASKFLWPFQLADSKTDFERRTLKLKDGKEYGDRGEAIHDYIQQVL